MVEDFMLRDKRDFADVIKVANWMAFLGAILELWLLHAIRIKAQLW